MMHGVYFVQVELYAKETVRSSVSLRLRTLCVEDALLIDHQMCIRDRVKTIFEVFMETGSLSKTDQYLLEHRCVTKRGKQFTRFAIRGILTNPVYMIADETAYQLSLIHISR